MTCKKDMGKKNGQMAQSLKVNFSLVRNMDVDNLFGPLYADMKAQPATNPAWKVHRLWGYGYT